MNIDDFKIFFEEELSNNNLNKNINYDSFYKYMNFILEWNKKINLTAIKDEKEFIIKHFVDSLTISELINPNSKVIDVGTGAGFPGIPLKIVHDDLNLTLVDSVNKKINVLKDIIYKLNLKNVETIHTRVEDIAHKTEYREVYDYAVSRAVSNLTTLSEYLLPLVKIGGKAICMKGPNFELEIINSKKAIKLLGGEIESVISLCIDENIERNIIIINKISNSPYLYPRSSGLPLKKPIS